MSAPLPIEAVLPELMAALKATGQAVLQAPPGAGKTTRVPLAMLEAGLTAGRILMLEPRRLATRSAADRMASSLDERAGQTVGYRMRGEAKVSDRTRIEVVTEGILTRMIQSDPALPGVGAILFDEFHERSLNADLGLALALECRAALREDLILLVMSATLEAAPVATLMGDAPVVTSEGQSFPVETRWLNRPAKGRFDDEALSLLTQAAGESEGGMLVFLPGEGEIRRMAGRLKIAGTEVLPLYGAMPMAEQRRVFLPTRGRKVVLATSIAETSLTIPDIRVVVDAGRARRARFDPGSGMSRLVTDRVSRAEADQRRGRAGRVAEGVCYRMWTKGEEGALAGFAPPEIETADLTGLALELAEWGARDLPFLTPPPEGPLAEAEALLTELGALKDGRITEHGKALARLPLHPRMGHMVKRAGAEAVVLAALLSDRDPMRGVGADMRLRLEALARGDRSPSFERIRSEARRLAKGQTAGKVTDPAAQAALAYPDRVALRRKGDDPRWLLSGGKGVKMSPEDALAGQRLLVVTDTDGHPTEATVRGALVLSEADLRGVHGDKIAWHQRAFWSRRDGRVETLEEERFGAIALSERRWTKAPDAVIGRAMLDGVRQLGLSPSPKVDRFRARVALLRAAGRDMPDLSDAVLLDSLDDWLLPHLGRVRSVADWKGFDLLPALTAMLDWPQTEMLKREAPGHFETPLGRKIPIDYGKPDPEIALRLQEMFGTKVHPVVAGRPLRVTLLSPAERPLQTTMDIPGFWARSYTDVRKDMRGRYPKHHWPEDPTEADPTRRAKPRK